MRRSPSNELGCSLFLLTKFDLLLGSFSSPSQIFQIDLLYKDRVCLDRNPEDRRSALVGRNFYEGKQYVVFGLHKPKNDVALCSNDVATPTILCEKRRTSANNKGGI